MPSSPLRLYFPDTDDLPLPPGHRFPARKYRMLADRVRADGIVAPENVAAAPLASRTDIERVHDRAYVDGMFTGTLGAAEQRRIGVPWSETLLERARATVGGTIAASRIALDLGVSGQLAGGTHHAHRDFGSGYCVFNDIAVATDVLREEGRLRRVGVLDLDVHQGDGNAALMTPDPEAFVASVHGQRNFPFRKVASDMDIGLEDHSGDQAYLKASRVALDAVLGSRPDIVFYISGVDPLREDRLGRLAVTMAGLAERDMLVCQAFRRTGVPLVIVIGGGYAEPIELTVTAYAQTFEVASRVFDART